MDTKLKYNNILRLEDEDDSNDDDVDDTEEGDDGETSAEEDE